MNNPSQMTVEPPQGLKANMLRSFGSGGTGTITEKKFEHKEAGPDWQKLLFGLCLFNSVIHERKKYGRLGWNILYGFNDSDLSVRYSFIDRISFGFMCVSGAGVELYITHSKYVRVNGNRDKQYSRSHLQEFFYCRCLSVSFRIYWRNMMTFHGRP